MMGHGAAVPHHFPLIISAFEELFKLGPVEEPYTVRP
jgi:hypothetical protein